MKNTAKKITQVDQMYVDIKEIFGSNATIYSTNYYNPGRRYQAEIVGEHGGAYMFGANLTKGSFRQLIELCQFLNVKDWPQEEKIDFWKKESNLKKYK
jgi:hypothetical protein